MGAKPLDSDGNRSTVAATGAINLADFPMGSLQSRAAARTLQRIKRASESDGDVYPPGWSARTAAQKATLASPADILFFGGAAGSLKTETMLVDAARESGNPNLRAIIFRQQRRPTSTRCRIQTVTAFPSPSFRAVSAITISSTTSTFTA